MLASVHASYVSEPRSFLPQNDHERAAEIDFRKAQHLQERPCLLVEIRSVAFPLEAPTPDARDPRDERS